MTWDDKFYDFEKDFGSIDRMAKYTTYRYCRSMSYKFDHGLNNEHHKHRCYAAALYGAWRYLGDGMVTHGSVILQAMKWSVISDYTAEYGQALNGTETGRFKVISKTQPAGCDYEKLDTRVFNRPWVDDEIANENTERWMEILREIGVVEYSLQVN
jgi:hypothetical protein